MATTPDYIEHVCEQITGIGELRYRKMFGEYMIYINDKPVLLVCDNTVYVKQLKEVAPLLENTDKGHPYDGAKEHYILDIDNKDLSINVLEILERITPLPKPRKKKGI